MLPSPVSMVMVVILVSPGSENQASAAANAAG
jgi:hypothetical protein